MKRNSFIAAASLLSAISACAVGATPQRTVFLIPLNGTRLAAVASLSPDGGSSANSLDFGDQLVGATSSPLGVTLANSGGLPLGVSSIKTSGPFAAIQNCPTSLAGGAGCNVNVTFTPTTTGPLSGLLQVTTDTGIQALTLDGNGVVGVLAVTPQSTLPLSSVAVGSSTTGSVTVSNSGTAPLTVNAPSVTGTGFTLYSNGCSTVAVGSSCQISVKFSPTYSGGYAGTLTITSNGGSQAIALSGTGLGGVASPSVNSLTFNTTAGSSTTSSVSITNTGNIALTVSTPSVSGSGFALASNTCSTLNASASCQITVRYTPSSSGNVTGYLTVPTSVGTQTLTLNGYASVPASCTLPWGGTLASGSSVTAYAAASAKTCTSQTRTCSNGTLTGSYSSASCVSPPASFQLSGFTCSGTGLAATIISDYMQYMNRCPDTPGLAWWENQYTTNGWTTAQLASQLYSGYMQGYSTTAQATAWQQNYMNSACSTANSSTQWASYTYTYTLTTNAALGATCVLQ